MKKIKHIISEIKGYLKRVFNSVNENRFHSGRRGILDFLTFICGGYCLSISFACECINAPAENISKMKSFLYRYEPKEWNKRIIICEFPGLITNLKRLNPAFRRILFKIALIPGLYGNSVVYIWRRAYDFLIPDI